MNLTITALLGFLLLFSPPTEGPDQDTISSQSSPEAVTDTTISANNADEIAAPSTEPAPEQAAKPGSDEEAVSPWVPRSQIEWLRPHPVQLDKVVFKPGKGLSFTSESKRFALTIGARVQMLYSLDHDNDPEADPDLQHLFQIRRARMVFGGHMFNEHNKFKIEFSFSPRDVGLGETGARFTIMRDYYLEFDYLRDLTLVVGQYKIPYSQQRVISSGKLQLVDRSITGPEFDMDREIGLDLRSEDFLGWNRVRYYAGVYFGSGRDNSTPEPVLRGGGLVYLGRIEILPFGLFDDYVEGDFKRTFKPRLSLGGAYAYMDDATLDRGTKGSDFDDEGTADYHNATASMVFKIAGLAMSGEFFWRRGVREPGDAVVEDELGNLVPVPTEPPRNGYGWYTQLGFMIPRVPVELAGRYSQVRGIGDETQTSTPDRDELGGGVSWYIAGHPYKLQADYFRVWDEDIATGRDQFRVQFQLSF